MRKVILLLFMYGGALGLYNEALYPRQYYGGYAPRYSRYSSEAFEPLPVHMRDWGFYYSPLPAYDPALRYDPNFGTRWER